MCMNTVHTSVPADPLTPLHPSPLPSTALNPPLPPSQVYQQILEEASREQLRQRRGFLRRMKLFHGLEKVHLTTVAQCCSDIRFGGERSSRSSSRVFTQDQHPGQGHGQGQGQDQADTKEVPISISSNDLLCKSATLQALPILGPSTSPYIPLNPLTIPLHPLTPPYVPLCRHCPTSSRATASSSCSQGSCTCGIAPRMAPATTPRRRACKRVTSSVSARGGTVSSSKVSWRPLPSVSSICRCRTCPLRARRIACSPRTTRCVGRFLHRAMHHGPRVMHLHYVDVTIRCGSIPTIRRSICSHLRSAPLHLRLCTPTLQPSVCTPTPVSLRPCTPSHLHLCLCAPAGHSHRAVRRHGEFRATALCAAARAARSAQRRREPAQVRLWARRVP